jgi:hypothetical protein
MAPAVGAELAVGQVSVVEQFVSEYFQRPNLDVSSQNSISLTKEHK